MIRSRQLLGLGLVMTISSAAHADGLRVDDVVQKLVAETATFNTTADGFQYFRPHPLVEKLAPGQELEILEKLSGSLTGDPIRDSYIRFHLLHPVVSSDQKMPGAPFQKLHGILPRDTGFAYREHITFDPVDVYREYIRLMDDCRVMVGFPPFQKRVDPPESFQYMTDAQRKDAEAKWERAKSLKFTRNVDAVADEWNKRVSWTPWMLRQVRGEAALYMVRSGEPKMLQAVIQLIAGSMTSDRQQALDYLAFLNAAYFNGYLKQYSPAVLKQTAQALKRIVTAADVDEKGNRIQKGSLSEKAFTLVTAMETGHVISPPSDGEMERPVLPLKHAATTAKVKPEQLTPEFLDNAIERALNALDGLRPPDTDIDRFSYYHQYRARWIVPSQILPGHQALASWAMLASGESRQLPWMLKRIGWIACYDSDSTYDRAMRLRAISFMDDPRWMPWIRRDAEWLITSMTDQGGFNAAYAGEAKPGFGDNANAAYAILGLEGARLAGYEINDAIWKKLDAYWRQAQFPEKTPGAGGWAVASYRSLKAGDSDKNFNNRVSSPMTASGLLALATTERFLLGPKRVDAGNKATPEFAAGLKWLDSNFDINQKIEGDDDLYYYLWTIQNVGKATGYRTFNKVDWFREATARLINEQGEDGTWQGPKGKSVSTSFALLYLYRARGPLAYCKVRFEPETSGKAAVSNWNNRPNDLANLTDEISGQLEVPTNWQIADLDQPAYQLAESVTLYLATDQAFKLSQPQIDRLREYLDTGGTLICVPEGARRNVVLASMRELAAALYPTRELQKVDPEHRFYSLQYRVGARTPISIVGNGFRPMVVLVENDIGRELQADAKNRRDAFKLMTNIYLYTTGHNPKRARLATNYVQRSSATMRSALRAARLSYSGDYDPEPASLSQLSALMSQHAVNLEIETLDPTALTEKQQFALITMTDKAKLSPEQIRSLKAWIEAGGTLMIDSAGGIPASVGAAEELTFDLGYMPGDFKPVTDGPIRTGAFVRRKGYDLTSYRYRTFNVGIIPTLRCAQVDGRNAVYMTNSDLAAGLAGVDHWGISGFNVPTARQLVANTLFVLLDPQPARKPTTQATNRSTTQPVTTPNAAN